MNIIVVDAVLFEVIRHRHSHHDAACTLLHCLCVNTLKEAYLITLRLFSFIQ